MSYLITFLPRGQGRFRFLPLGPLATPITPLKRSLREGYGTVRRVYTAPKSCPHEMGKVAWRSHDERGITKKLPSHFTFPPQSATPTSPPFYGGAFGMRFTNSYDKTNQGNAAASPISFNILPYPLCLSVPLASSSSSFAAGSFTLARNIMAAIMYGLKLACL